MNPVFLHGRESKRPNLLIKLGIWILVVFLASEALLYFGAPLIAKIWNTQNTEVQIGIKHLYINPFLSSLGFVGFSAYAQDENESQKSSIYVPSGSLDLKILKSISAGRFVLGVKAKEPQLSTDIKFQPIKEPEEKGPQLEVKRQNFFKKLLDYQTKIIHSEKFQLNSIDINNASIDIWQDSNTKVFRVYDTDLKAESRGLEKESYRQLILDGKTSGNGKFSGFMELIPGEAPKLDIDFKLEGLKLQSLQKYFHEFLNADPDSGELSVFLEAGSKEKKLGGYVKVLVKDLKFYSERNDKDEPIGDKIWEGLVDVFRKVFENQKTNTLAFRIPISGEIDDFQINYLSALISLVRNAFVSAIQPGFEKNIEFL